MQILVPFIREVSALDAQSYVLRDLLRSYCFGVIDPPTVYCIRAL